MHARRREGRGRRSEKTNPNRKGCTKSPLTLELNAIADADVKLRASPSTRRRIEDAMRGQWGSTKSMRIEEDRKADDLKTQEAVSGVLGVESKLESGFRSAAFSGSARVLFLGLRSVYSVDISKTGIIYTTATAMHLSLLAVEKPCPQQNGRAGLRGACSSHEMCFVHQAFWDCRCLEGLRRAEEQKERSQAGYGRLKGGASGHGDKAREKLKEASETRRKMQTGLALRSASAS
ncbi:hypothetical protein C8F01DRAFT_1075357 [Mycena amicta]|nr:hypothetical protein C8F01DRAFT_1075357 [Mycena amicta]